MGNTYNPVYFVTSASYDVSNGVSLVVNGTPSISEHSKFVIRFAPNIAVPNGVPADAPVSIVVGDSSYTVKDKFGEPIKFSEIPLSPFNNSFFSPRLTIVGGVGSETINDSLVFYYIAFNLPIPRI